MNMRPESSRLVRTVLGLTLMAAADLALPQQSLLPEADDALQAEEALPRYSVEVILFTYNTSVSAGTEIFVADEPPAVTVDDAVSILNPYPGEPSPDRQLDAGIEPGAGDAEEETIPTFGDMVVMPDADSLATEELEPILDAGSVDLRVLPVEALTMTAIHEKLLRLDAYRPVLWSGWTQIVREDSETPAVRLRRLGNVPLEMEGDLKLYLGRFLHLVVDVSMQAPSTQRNLPPPRRYGDSRFARDDVGYGTPPIYYRIADDRIIKSGDVRYFDHPKFGILAKLSRVEEPQEPALEDSGPLEPGTTGNISRSEPVALPQ